MHSRLGRRSALVLSTSLLGLVAALPASPAGASPQPAFAVRAAGAIGSSGTLPSYALGATLTPAQVQELLAKLPLGGGTSPLTPAELAAALAHLPGLEALGLSGLEQALRESLEKLGTSVTLEEALANPASLLASVTTTVEKLLSLEELLALKGLLGGATLTQELQEALQKANGGELLQSLLAHGSEGPGKTVEGLLAALPSSTLQGLLGSGLGTGPASEQTVEQLAGKLGMTATQLGASVSMNASELPATAKAVTMPLSNGTVVSVLDGVNKALVGTLDAAHIGGTGEGEGGSGGGSGGGTGGGGTGGSGGTGAGSGGAGSTGGGSLSAVAGGTTVIVNLPSTPVKPSKRRGGKRARRVRVIGAKVRGAVATLEIEVPSAGILTLRNRDIRTIIGRVRRAGLVRVQVRLSKAGLALAKRRHHKLRLRLRIAFKPARGAASTAWKALLFR
jgi:hypothetical protein